MIKPCLILSEDDVVAIWKMLRISWNKENIEKLQKMGCLDLANEIRQEAQRIERGE